MQAVACLHTYTASHITPSFPCSLVPPQTTQTRTQTQTNTHIHTYKHIHTHTDTRASNQAIHKHASKEGKTDTRSTAYLGALQLQQSRQAPAVSSVHLNAVLCSIQQRGRSRGNMGRMQKQGRHVVQGLVRRGRVWRHICPHRGGNQPNTLPACCMHELQRAQACTQNLRQRLSARR